MQWYKCTKKCSWVGPESELKQVPDPEWAALKATNGVCPKCGAKSYWKIDPPNPRFHSGPGEPCGPTCQGHVTHPCEECGRQWG